MIIEIQETKEVNVTALKVEAGVRYWEDATVNGVKDEEGTLIPCREGDYWNLLINLDDGKILNWKQGVSASVHYKVCDAGKYSLMNKIAIVVQKKDVYVPKMLCPKEEGYGDYIIMDIDDNGFIQKWKVSFNEFEPTNN